MKLMAATEKADLSRITVVPGQRSGQACIRGLRVTVWDVLDTFSGFCSYFRYRPRPLYS